MGIYETPYEDMGRLTSVPLPVLEQRMTQFIAEELAVTATKP